MSALAFHKLTISNPAPVLAPCGANSTFVVSGARNLEGSSQAGALPYGGAASPERDNMVQWWNEMITRHGLRMKYWAHGYDMTMHDGLYGEHPTAVFADEELLLVIAERAGESMMFSKFGFQGAAEVKVAVEIEEFARVFGTAIPKPGDLFTFPDAYVNRPAGLGPKLFEVTMANDDDLTAVFLGGHYVWILDAVTWHPSYEQNAPRELQDNLVTDSEFAGILPGFPGGPSPSKVYSYTADADAATDFDQDLNNEGRDSVYGDY